MNISINDVNDNKPEFTSSLTLLPLAENTGTNTTLYTVHAEDDDSGSNGRVRYQLTQNTQQMFQINPNTGALSLQVTEYTNEINDMLGTEFNLEINNKKLNHKLVNEINYVLNLK